MRTQAHLGRGDKGGEWEGGTIACGVSVIERVTAVAPMVSAKVEGGQVSRDEGRRVSIEKGTRSAWMTDSRSSRSWRCGGEALY